MIFDSHMHIGSLGAQYGVSLDAAGLVERMRENAIDAGALFAPENEAVREVVESVPGIYGLYWANPRVPGVLEEARAYLGHPGFVGIKLHPTLDGYPADVPALDPYLEVAAEAGRPVAVHSAPGDADPKHIRRLAERHPTVPVILYHTYLGPAEGRRRAVRYLGDHPNLYLETSWCRWRTVVRFVEQVGPDRVLFGSDASVDGPAHYRRQPPNVEGAETYNDGLLALVGALGPEATRAVLAENTRRVFRLDEPAGQSNVR